VTVVSIYVNPSQFAPDEDLQKYPRMLEADLEKLAACGVDMVLAPSSEEVYHPGHVTWVEVGGVAEPLEGRCRPGHFRGVATIVLKLLSMMQPDAAYFGQKDYQQALVIRRMVADLNVPVEIRVCPTVREPDGLAMSSRNAYLGPDARQRAVVLWKSLQLAAELVAGGDRDAGTITQRMREMILTAKGAQIDYVALVDPETLQPVERLAGPTLAALAVKIDGTRLIDNEIVQP
jgi:pantoate--beta-alanine ligase